MPQPSIFAVSDASQQLARSRDSTLALGLEAIKAMKTMKMWSLSGTHTQIWIWNWLWKQTNCRPGLPTAKLKKLTYRTLNLPPTELWNSETTATGHNRMHGAFEVQIRCLREMTMERLFWCTDICTAILSECIFHQDLPSNSPLSWIYEPHTVIVQNCSSNKWRNYRRKSFKTS